MLKGAGRQLRLSRNGPIRDEIDGAPALADDRRAQAGAGALDAREAADLLEPPLVEAALLLARSCTSPPEGRHRVPRTPSVSRPGDTPSTRRRLRSRRPEATARTKARATSETKSAERRRWRAAPPVARVAGLAQSRLGIVSRCLRGGSEAEDEAGQQVDAARVKRSTTVSILVSARRGISGGARRSSGPERPGRQHEHPGRPRSRKATGFRSGAVERSGPAGADGRADRELPAPRRSPGQQQVRDVGACDQKHDAHGREQDPEGRPEVS